MAKTDRLHKALRELADVLDDLNYSNVRIQYSKGVWEPIIYEEGLDPLTSRKTPDVIKMEVEDDAP